MTLVVARSLSFPNRWMLESFAQLATATKTLKGAQRYRTTAATTSYTSN
jgi:hypothetical protein